MANMRIKISLIDEHDDDKVLSSRILESIWTVVPEHNKEMKIPSNLFLEEVSEAMSENINYILKNNIKSMINELMTKTSEIKEGG